VLVGFFGERGGDLGKCMRPFGSVELARELEGRTIVKVESGSAVEVVCKA
jgi:hypothetical protein